MDKPLSQFSIQHLFVVISLVAIGLAGDLWIINSDLLKTHPWFPFFAPPFGVAPLLFGGAPVVAIGALPIAIYFWVRCRPLPFTPTLFFLCVPVIVMIPPSAVMRMLVVLTCYAVCVLIETLARRLSHHGYFVFGCLLLVTCCYYLFFVGLNAVLSV